MSKKTKRLVGILAVTVLVVALCIAGFVMATAPGEDPVCYVHGDVNGDGKVNKDDAIYLLYASFPGLGSEFPMNQDGEMDNNDGVNKDDAIYLLYASVPGNEQIFPLKGEVHSYYDPTWVWDETAGTAKVTFKCGCSPEGHEVAATVTVVSETAPTCVKAGSRVLSAKATFDGKDYQPAENKTIVLPATGQHALNEASCTVDLACANCDYKVAAPGHSMALKSTTPATCTADGVEVYKCANCDYTEDVPLTKLGHTLTYLEGQDVSKGNCTFVKQYSCSVCSGVFDGTAEADTYVKHSYVTELTKEATCCADGEMTTACEYCPTIKGTEVMPMDSSKHAWDDGTKESGKITFTCTQTGCDETKVEVVTEEGKVDASKLNANTGVNLGNNTSVAMDQNVLDTVGDGQITISVEQKNKSEIAGLSEEKAKQIPAETVYDFTLKKANGDQVSNFGMGRITVTLPYALQPGDDINSIDIWYIDDEGQTRQVDDASYSNGYVTFTTDHFSYYTVTHLTPVERCARLGSHIGVQQQKAATCTEDGYNMTVCQRCGEVISKEIFEKTGHNYKDSEQAATCLADGLLTRTCINDGCTHMVTKTLPALGHDMKQDTVKTVAPTCNAAGKSVKACSCCDYTAEEPLAQLTHKYEKSDEKSVAATCSAAGYDVYVCTLCDDERRKNDIAPLGHNFVEKKDGWKWTDNASASVTLVCENDVSHTKELTAVVTKNEDKSQNTSCLGSGSVVYEATVSYNGKTYTSVNEITVAAPGHKPGTAWESSATQHYHVCSVCSEKIGAEAHAWNEGTVTKEATCKESGSKTVKCTVCDYEKSQQIPATGEHNYVNGVCTGCGSAQTDCRHLPINKTRVDNVALGICDSAVFYRYSCDCGQAVEYEIEDYSCEFVEGEPEKIVDEYGLVTHVNRATCKDCGMEISLREGYTADTENCSTTYTVTYSFYKDGALVAEQQIYNYESKHPGVIEVDRHVIQDERLCGDINVVFKKCFCGKYTTSSIGADCSFGWGVGPGYDNTSIDHGMCINCGVEQLIEHNYADVESCLRETTNAVSFRFDKEALYVYEETHGYENHNEVLTDHEKLGDSCTDGIIVRTECSKCGKADEGFIREHETLQQERIELPGSCSGCVIQRTCLCDAQYADCEMGYNDGDESCYMEWAYDKETGEEFWMCYECGLKRYERITYGDKDADCVCMADSVYTYKNAEGVAVATGKRRYQTTQHEMKYDYTLPEGVKNCEDGVFVREYCTDCAYEYSYEMNYHEQYLANTYDLSALGGCMKKINLYRCACGRVNEIRPDTYCDQQYVDTPVENQEIWKCRTCGMLETITYSYPETDDPCMNHVVRVYTYSMEGVDTTVRFTTEEFVENHSYVYDVELKDGAVTCMDGWTASGICSRCGETDSRTGYWHETFTLSEEQVDGGKMCGTVVKSVSGCACGQNRNSYLEWDEEARCEFTSNRYDSTLDTWIYSCAKCGSYYYEIGEEVPSATQPCRIEMHTTIFYCDKDGNELFRRERDSWRETHSMLVQFLNPDGSPWSGTDCAQGYQVVEHCTKCGEQRHLSGVYTECENYPVGREQLYDGTGMCGPVVLVHLSCPCGKQTRTSVEYSCNVWNYDYDNKVGKERWTCGNCGAYYYNESNSEAVPGNACQIKWNVTRTFYVDGVLACTAKYSYINDSHLERYVYEAEPNSCEEGWSASIYCVRCDKYIGRSTNNTGHSRNTVESYDLSDYGMCDGYLVVERCACGEKAGWNFSQSQCEWSNMGTDENGTITYYCQNCDTYSYRTEAGQTDAQCNYTGTAHLQFVRGGQTVLDVTADIAGVRHSERVVDVWLVTEGTSCEEGIYQRWECRNCGYSYVSEGSRYHARKETDRIETECGSVITREACCCDQEAYVEITRECDFDEEYKYTGNEWKGTETHTLTCENCGLEWSKRSSWDMPEDTCEGVRTGTVTVNYNGQTYGLTFSYSYTSHRQRQTRYTLKPGATTCVGNLIATDVCLACGETSTWNPGDGHRMNLVSTLDLKSYGATCGGKLYRYQCPCEATGRYEFDKDNLCKLQQQGAEIWIENVINDQYNYGTNDGQWLYSYAWTYTCAVTEPACDLRMRMAEYWLQEGCAAVEYQTWQYFDASTEQWVTMDTVATGDTYSWHNYTKTQVDTTEDGAKVTGTRNVCACGAYYNELRYEYADGTYKDTVDAFDGKGVNNNSERHTVFEYNCLYNNNQFVTRNYKSYTQDGRKYWSQSEYTYDFADNCKVTRVYTSSDDSEPSTYVEHHVRDHTDYTTEKSNSCTQPGKQKWEDYCAACEKMYDSGYYTIEPSNHRWVSNGEAGWKCYNCGLEDRNGASEGIVLEDLTEEFGNGTNYVAGYWNKDEVAVVKSVCAVVEGQNPIYLEGVEFTEHTDPVAISFNMAQAHAAADALVNGAAYQLRLNLVTIEGESMEYAITFTDARAQ